jgi:hypothetical protein
MNTLRIPYDFDRAVTPEAIQEYYLSCCPSSSQLNEFFQQSGLAYLNSIALYYLHQASQNQQAPGCTLANVLATAKYCDVVLVLHTLKTDEASAALVAPLLKALDAQAYTQLAGIMATLRSPLNQLHIPIEARQRVHRFLPTFVPK